MPNNNFDTDMYWNERGGKVYAKMGVSVPLLTYKVHSDYQKEWVANILRKRKSSICATTSLLDFGCGNGDLFDCWKKIPEVFAYDRSYTMLHQSRIHNRKEGYNYKIAGPISANRVETPYRDSHFDYVMMMTVLAHLCPGDIPLFAKELRRISRPGAIWSIVTSMPFHEEWDVKTDTGDLYMWDHDYEEFLGSDVKILDDHVLEPYRYIEVQYVGEPATSETGRTCTIQSNGTLRRPHGRDRITPQEVDGEFAKGGNSVA